MLAAVIVGKAFLWHQIRCMMAILFAVGDGLEGPEIVPRLLDVERTPRKPQYEMASELPLVLFDCSFEDLHFIGEPHELAKLEAHVLGQWQERQVMATLTDQLRSLVLGAYVPTTSVPFEAREAIRPKFLQWHEARRYAPGARDRAWVPLLQRPSDRAADAVALATPSAGVDAGDDVNDGDDDDG